jgi:acetolactate synthase-1/2/3 large subunit
MISGGRLVAKAIRGEGVECVFTLCGGHVSMIYDGCLDEGIRVVDVRHEQTAGHAADGWARVTGKPGVAIVTAGPGVTDAVTAAANAWRAQVPMVLIGGQGPRAFQDMGSLQEMDHVGLLRTITKWSVTVPETRRLTEYMQTAFRIATSGVPGPVFLEMPLDVLANFVNERDVTGHAGYRTPSVPAPDPSAIDAAVALLATAERPMLILGSQYRWTPRPEALDTFLAKYPLPTYQNGMARCALPLDHPCLMLRSRKAALKAADVVLVIGTPFDFRLGYGMSGWASGAKVIQIDLDGSTIGRNRTVDVGIPSDAGLALDALAASVPARAAGPWLQSMRDEDDKQLAKIADELTSDATPINPLRACADLADVLPTDAIVVGDGGDFVATAASVLRLGRGALWMDPGPLGTLGVGPGYAMAAKLAFPKRTVCLVYGDGSFGLHGLEFEAMVRQDIPVLAVIGNDAAWTQIRRAQVQMYGEQRSVATKLAMTRYDKVVEAVGGFGAFCEKPSEVKPALEAALASGKPACVNIAIGASQFRKDAISV